MQKAQFSEKLSLIISGISSPFILAFGFSLVTIAAYTARFSDFFLLGGEFVLFSSIIPFLFVWLGVKTGRFTDIHVMLHQQRALPFLVSTLSVFILLIIYYFEKTPLALQAMALVLVVNGLLYLGISHFWKISMHSSSLAASSVTLGVLVAKGWYFLFLALPVVIWARVKRKKHTVAQSISGALLVSLTTYVIYALLGLV